MSTRKLLISTISILRASPRFPAHLIPKFNVFTVFSFSSYHVGKPNVFHNCDDHLLMKYMCSHKNFYSQSVNASSHRCWNCNAVAVSKPFLACEFCRSVQPMDHSVDYFQIFGLERNYDIEDVNLEKKYKDWQKKLHPDLVHTKSEKEKEYAAEQSAQVIDAYHTLRAPLLRAIYLLRLNGVHVDEEQTVSEPELLGEIMEIREAVDDAADSQALKQIQCQVNAKLERWSKSFADSFNTGNFEDAVTSTQRMRYYHRINEEIVKKL